MAFKPDRKKSVQIMKSLGKTYSKAKCELTFDSPLQLLVSVILSAQCTDKRVNMVTPGLFKKFPDAEAFAKASQEGVEKYIRSTGFYRNKAKNIRACCQEIVKRFGGKVPDRMEDLVTLPGVGRKTANVILYEVFGKNEGVCVDTHVLRLSKRLGFTMNTTPEKVEVDLMQLFPKEDWGHLTQRLIWHGRRRCFARNPDFKNCELKSLCPCEKFSFSEKK